MLQLQLLELGLLGLELLLGLSELLIQFGAGLRCQGDYAGGLVLQLFVGVLGLFGLVERATAELLRAESGIRTVFTRGDILAHQPPAGRAGEQAMRSYVPGRSGDVVGIPLPYWIPTGTNAHHWTGYSFDRMVPLVMAGWGIRHQRFAHTVEIIDIAPTLATLSGVLHPALSEGRVLHEALRLPEH